VQHLFFKQFLFPRNIPTYKNLKERKILMKMQE
jgi:hypothetical protein